MFTIKSKVRGVALVGGVLAGAVLFLAVTAFAEQPQADPQTMTGCINEFHKLVKVAVGTAPSSPCTGTQTQVSVSGGDITAKQVTGALQHELATIVERFGSDATTSSTPPTDSTDSTDSTGVSTDPSGITDTTVA